MPKLPGLKQFRDSAGGVSYFVFDPVGRELAVIDPRADLMQDYRDYIAEHRLRPVLVIDTKLHAHHLSGSHLLASEFRVQIGMSGRTASARVSRKLSHGERLAVGAIELEVLEAPGTSPDAICLSVAPDLLFTGETLLIGTGARVDAPGGDARILWESLRRVVGKLPSRTVLLPGHDFDDRLFSLLEIECVRNPDLRAVSAEELARLKAAEASRLDPEAKARTQYNADPAPIETRASHFGEGSPAPEGAERGRVATISVDKFSQKVREGGVETCFLDVREPEEFRQGHIPGAINIPLSELALRLDELFAFRRIYVSCQAGRRSLLAAKTLDYLGLPHVVNVSGGFQAWIHAGYEADSAGT